VAICFPGTSGGDAGCWFCQFGLTRDYPPLSAFLKDLGEAGFVEGRDVAIEYRWAKGDMSACLRSSIILVQRRAGVIVATSAPAVMAARGGSDPTRSCLQR